MSDDERRLDERCLLLGVTGSIAAYKAALLVRLFKKAGAKVQVLMTPDAARFVTPLTLGTLSERPVLTEIFPEQEAGRWTKHVELGCWADLFVVAPATAQTLAKLAHGFSDSMLTATALSARCPLLVCPAMDRDMYAHPATQANLRRLEDFSYAIMPAAEGELASGLTGQGRLPEPEAIFERVAEMLGKGERRNGRAGEGKDHPNPQTPSLNTLTGQTVLVTAGPTREPIDPVRMLTNPSTGTMGYALAAAAARRGARVTLVSGPTALDAPPGVTRVDVTTAEEMHAAVQARADADLVLMAAAIADYTPAAPSASKLKKDGDLVLRLRRTPDVLAALGRRKRSGQQLLGFALETGAPEEALARARRKIDAKNLDWIVLNSAAEEGSGFGTATNRVTLLHRSGHQEELPRMSKANVAEALLDRISKRPAKAASETSEPAGTV